MARGTHPQVHALSEFAAKALLRSYGVPCVAEALAATTEEAVGAARVLGFPVAVKGCGSGLLHKTDLGLVELGLGSAGMVRQAAARLLDRMNGRGTLLVQQMVSGAREFMIGMARDSQFGPVVSFGLGGVFAEVLADVASRVAPFDACEAEAMLGEIRARRLLGEVRGLPAVDRTALVRTVLGIGRLAIERPDIREIDINPLVVTGASPIAVDALVMVEGT
jgi:acetyl-CoA synthetase (ADP-forming)